MFLTAFESPCYLNHRCARRRLEVGDWLRGRAHPSHGWGRWFESSIAHHFGELAQLGERMTGSHEVSGSIPLISTKTKSHSVRNGFFVLAGHTWREKRCGSTECIFAAQKRRFFCMQCRKHKKMQSARRRRSRRSIPLIVPLSFLENQPHFFSHAT